MEYFIAIASTLFYLSVIYLVLKGNNLKKFFEKNKTIFIFLTIILIFITALTIFGVIFSQKDLGSFGDFFGGILNPLIGFIGIVFLFLTFKITQKTLEMTQETLKITKEELQETRKEFKQANEIYQAQKLEMEKQTFDNKFFQMLSLFNEIANNIKIDLQAKNENNEYVKDKESNGKASFFDINQSIIDNLPKIDFPVSDITKFSEEVKHYFNQHLDIFYSKSNYFLTLYQILKFLNSSNNLLNFEKQKSYSNIVRSQLTENELITILFNFYRLKNKKHQILIEKYNLFEHLNMSYIRTYMEVLAETLKLDEKDLQKEIILSFDVSAFGDNQGMIDWYEELKNS